MDPSAALPLLPDCDWHSLTAPARGRWLAEAGYVVVPDLLPTALVARLRQRVARLATVSGETPALQAAVDVRAGYPAFAAVAGDPTILDHVGGSVRIDYWRWAPGAPGLAGFAGRSAILLLDDMTPAAAPLVAGAPPGLLTARAGSAILVAGGRALAAAPHRGLLISERLVVRPA